MQQVQNINLKLKNQGIFISYEDYRRKNTCKEDKVKENETSEI